MPETTKAPALWQRIRCFFGKHPGEERTFGPYPYPDAYNCTSCGRLLYLIDHNVSVQVFTNSGEREVRGIRYDNLDQWLEERAHVG